MMKKHLITCSVILVLAIIFKLNIYSTTVNKPVKKAYKASRFIFINNDAANELSFANESLPVNDATVNRKMMRCLMKHDFKRIQSNTLHNQAEKLFPIIEPILKFYGIPDDFKYIPLVESGLNPGTSPKGAAGPWQFMAGTARTYGLKVNSNIDERLNIRKATIAACRYIKDLYVEFNSWTLAAAAYNDGSIKMEKAINAQSEDNYFRMHLNSETGAYVYNIIAMKEIIRKPKKYGYLTYFPSPELLAVN